MLKVENKKNNLNHVIFVLDSSGSMAGLRKEVVKVCNKWFDDLRENSRKHKQETVVSFITFANKAEVKFKNKSVDKLNLDEDLYFPDGMTALFDGLKLAIDQGKSLGEDYSNLVVVVTDGLENNSSSVNVSQSPNILKTLQNVGNWSFVFLLPPGNKNSFCNNYHVLNDNVQEWVSDSKGVKEAEVKTSAGFSNYYASRSSGQRSVKNFFADLSKLNTTKVRNNLDDISSECEVYTVPKEVAIRDFVENKTGQPYELGSSYYQLSKDETVSSKKNLLIMKKGQTKIYSGDAARKLIGLPVGQDVKVKPLNFADWELYVQSSSVNRKLVRGTKLIVRSI